MRLKEIVIIFFLIHMLNANTQEISENTFLFCIKPNIQPLEKVLVLMMTIISENH